MNDKQSVKTENTDTTNIAAGHNIQQQISNIINNYGIPVSVLLKLTGGFGLFTVIVIVSFLYFSQTPTQTFNPYNLPPAQLIQYSEQFGITKAALSSFFKILDQEAVPFEDLDNKLREIAENYKKLQERAAQLVSDDPAVQALQKKAIKALEQADFENADKWLLEASEKDAQAIAAMEAEAQRIQEAMDKRKLSKADTLATLAESKQTQLRYAEAGELYQQAAALLPQGYEEQQAKYLNDAGFNFYHAGLYPQALPLYQRSLAILEKVSGENHPSVATSLNNLAELHRTQGKYEQALPLYQRSLAILEKVLGENHPDVASSLNNLAGLYRIQGEYEQALPLYQRSLAIREKVLGENHPDVATSLNNLAELYRVQGEYEQALPLSKRSLVIFEKVLGENHPYVASSLNNLAELYRIQGEYEQALPLYQRSLAIWEKVLGENHPHVASSLNNLALLYQSQGEYEQALPLYQRSLTIREKVLGENHPSVATSLNNLAGLYYAQGEYEQALPLYQRSLAIREKVLGDNHPDVAQSLNNLALLYDAQGEYEQALPLFQQAIRILIDKLGENHPNTQTGIMNYVSCLAESKGMTIEELIQSEEGFLKIFKQKK